MAYPGTLTNAVDGITEIIADYLNNLEAKVGINNSLVTSSLDYLVMNTGSVDPGHRQSELYSSGGTILTIKVNASGLVGIGNISTPILSGNGKLHINGDTIRVNTDRTPSSVSATGYPGEICWDSNYIYTCIATNSWKRSSLATWS